MNIHKKILLFTFCFFFILSLSLTVFLILAIETQPRIDRQATLTPEHVARAKHILDTHRDQIATDQLTTANILAKDADIAANYLTNHFAKGSAQIATAKQSALVHFSLPVPLNLFNVYLNIEATLIQTAALPQLQAARIGSLVLPDFITHLLASQTMGWLQSNPVIRKGLDVIKWVQLSPNKITITYNNRRHNLLAQEINFPVFSREMYAQLYRYHMLLVKNSRNSRTVPLSEILRQLMHAATKYSINGDAIIENRAVILASTFHTLGISARLFIPEADNWPSPTEQLVTLEGRNDFARHFIASAAITAYSNTNLSDAIGLYKEIADSHQGSGFSFSDIAANRAGARFGEKAVTSLTDAQQLQQIVSKGLVDADLMPLWSDLPDHMSDKQFKTHFGNTETPAFQKIIQVIDDRISLLNVLR